jgi:peptide deformylase
MYLITFTREMVATIIPWVLQGIARGERVCVAIRPIVAFPEPVLTRRTQKVTVFDASLPKLVEDMVETMRDASGVGLAANQIGVPLMLCVIEIPEEEEVRVLVNPELVSQEGERKLIEGCLSVPGYQGQVLRSNKVKVRYQDLKGRKQRLTAEGNLLAQALEHEIGHLNGEAYLQHLVAKDAVWKVGDEPPPEYAEDMDDKPLSRDEDEGNEAEEAGVAETKE